MSRYLHKGVFSYSFEFNIIKINLLFSPTSPAQATLNNVASVDDVGFLKTFLLFPHPEIAIRIPFACDAIKDFMLIVFNNGIYIDKCSNG